ncbi:Spo0E like sporulation regulatory protein [Thermobacillus composti KWC4]|uniref:Spo0E like sporulation regulatory protein n=2 Tax=Paenibacillaceae TaxID=186822 RepID=L0EJ37_THECK|nr:Spo0E like sporulation regulatory protein [Thermobacillus composti KWC4]
MQPWHYARVEKRQKKVESNRQKLTNSVDQEVYNGSTIHNFYRGRLRQMKKDRLLGQLQTLRFRLHALAEARGSLTDPEVLALSEEADRLIVALQQLQRDELTIPDKKAPRL